MSATRQSCRIALLVWLALTTGAIMAQPKASGTAPGGVKTVHPARSYSKPAPWPQGKQIVHSPYARAAAAQAQAPGPGRGPSGHSANRLQRQGLPAHRPRGSGAH
jgi:hypothetical protein